VWDLPPCREQLHDRCTIIATLPQDDPLFVAEIVGGGLEENFENPTLMREFGLILENSNGFGEPATMRGVPHVLGLSISTLDIDGIRSQNGWSGDGAPTICPAGVDPLRCPDFDGTLRAFALGAVIQHAPKTTARIPGIDFRLPTAEELDALEAFQLSLGLQEELDLPLPLKGLVPFRGQQSFMLDSDGGGGDATFATVTRAQISSVVQP